MFFSRLNTNQSLFIMIVISLAIKTVMAYVVPITGDEAYFIQWGLYPDYGFYDHPPMVGWWLTALLSVSKAAVWLRMPSIVGTTLIGWVIYKLVSPRDKQIALYAAGLFLLMPGLLIFPWITTDTPLIILSFFSAVCFYKAQARDSMSWYLLAGVLLGAAFFSKFFAGLLGIAYLTYIVLFVRRGIRPYLGILVVLLGVAPFIAANLYWNYTHCWDNYLFNLENRTSDYKLSLSGPLLYAAILLYLVTPPVIYYLFRRRTHMLSFMRNDKLGVFLVLFLVPVILFIPISLGKSIGLHWLLSFYPFIFIALALLLNMQQMRVCLYFMVGFSVLHLLVFGVLWSMTPGIFKSKPSLYQELVFAKHSRDLLKLIDTYRNGFTLATPSYARSSIFEYESGQHVIVMGAGSYHGRQDDMLTDFSTLNHQSIAIFSYNDDVKNNARFFESFTHIVLPYMGTQYHLGIGIGFKYDLYKKEILEPIKQRYYHIPSWLPRGKCYMDAR